MFFLYNGIECLTNHRLDLFEIDEINWENYDYELEDLIIKLNTLKKEKIFVDGVFDIDFLNEDAATIKYSNNEKTYYGIFNFEYSKDIIVNLKDGKYLNILTNEYIDVSDSKVASTKNPLILKI